MLADYPPEIVALAADPRTGIAGKSKFLPAVAEVKEFCDAEQTRRARIARYAALPKPAPREYRPPSREPNLFIPVGFHRYEKMAQRHAREPGFCRFEQGHTCQDAVARDGLWVPLEWWQGEEKASEDVLAAASRRAFEQECIREGVDPNGNASPSLRRLLGEQNANAESSHV